MGDKIHRRTILQAMGAVAVGRAASIASVQSRPPSVRMPFEGSDTPKICLGALDEVGMRRLKQIGVDYVLMGGPGIPWSEADIRARIERFKTGGLTVCNAYTRAMLQAALTR